MSVQVEHELIGTTVKSRAVGDKESFSGVVREAWQTWSRRGTITYFHVEDLADGSGWHRLRSELDIANDNTLPADGAHQAAA